ncbi:MAG TPA: phosphoglycerate dehydrogenase [Alphaproteobacteria bacterium]|nr:phosphoglycerate dehydrogenase [Alphaproteobacteria bacterium]
MTKVLVADNLSPRAVDVFKQRGIEADVKVGLKEPELIGVIDGYDGLAIRSATKVTASVLEAARNLKVVGRAGIGVDNVDLAAATSRGVVVMNTPFGNAITTAEHAIAMMFALARQIPQADRSTQAGRWEKNRFMGVELTNKTLGIVGCGNIGSIVAERARALHMKVIAFDPFLLPERAASLSVERVELETLFRRADVITLHVPLTNETRNLINRDTLKLMKKGVRIVNCARGGLVDEAALREALDAGQVAGAAFDVYEVEPAKENVLFGHENFVATPHLGASTEEAQENVALQVAEQISDFLLTGAIVNSVNTPSISPEQAPILKPYMQLAEQLGNFLGQLSDTAPKAITVQYAGHVAELDTRPLTAVILQGLFKRSLETVNMVNAPQIARERGVQVREQKNEATSDYQTLIVLTVDSEDRERSLAGTIFGGKRPRLVRIQDIPIDAELGKHMLYTRNRDKPGFIGSLGTALAESGINIATFHLGRSAPGGDAIALVQVDQPLTFDVIDKICGLPHTIKARALTF